MANRTPSVETTHRVTLIWEGEMGGAGIGSSEEGSFARGIFDHLCCATRISHGAGCEQKNEAVDLKCHQRAGKLRTLSRGSVLIGDLDPVFGLIDAAGFLG